MKDIFRNKNFVLLFFGNLVSEIGNALYGFAVGLYILNVTGSSTRMAIFLAISIGVRLLMSPVAGVIVDRVNRVRIIYITDFIRGFVFLLTGFVVVSGINPDEIIFVLYITAVLSSINGAFFGPAITSSVPEIVGEDHLQAANGAQSIVGSIQNIIGLLLGAILFSLLGIEWIIFINAFSFIFSGISEMFIKTPYKKEKTITPAIESKPSMLREFTDGLKYIFKKEGLFVLVLFFLVLNFAFSPLFSVGIPYLFNNLLLRDPIDLANSEIVLSATMLIAGFIVGNMKFKNVVTVIQKGIMMLSFMFVLVSIAIYLITSNTITFTVFYIIFLLIMVGLAFFLVFVNVPLNTGLVKAIEPEMRGRVFSTVGAISSGAIPLSMIIGGLLIDYYSINVLSLFCVVMMLIPTFGLQVNKKVKTILTSIHKPKEVTLQEE